MNLLEWHLEESVRTSPIIEVIMKIRIIGFIGILALGLLAVPLRADAQQPEKVYRIGYLGQTRVSNNFRKGLR